MSPHPIAPATDPGSAAPRGCTWASGHLARAVVISTLSSIISGYDQGVMASALLTMRPDLNLTSLEVEACVGAVNIAAAFGGLIAGTVADRLGRRSALAIAHLCFIAGSAALAVCVDFNGALIGRLLQGVGVGFALVIAPIYTAEIVPQEVRGLLVSLGDVCTNLGILAGYAIGLAFLGVDGGWRWMYGGGCVPPMCILVLLCVVPESPRWLFAQNKVERARHVLVLLTGSVESASHQVAAMERAKMDDDGPPPWSQVLCPPDRAVRAMVWRGFGIAFFSQAMGTEAVTYYVGAVMREAGVQTMRNVLLAITGVGVCKLVFLLIASPFFDRAGRRPMLLLSAASLFVSLCLLAGAESSDPPVPWLAVLGLCAFMASFSVGFSPLVYVCCSELFPSSVRAPAMSIALFTTRIVAGIISSSFVSLREALTPAGGWLFFAPIALAAFVFVYCFIPETKGRSLESMYSLFAHHGEPAAKRPRRRRCCLPWGGNTGTRNMQLQDEPAHDMDHAANGINGGVGPGTAVVA